MFWQERQVLDPIERVSEVLFGLIMVLTFTGSLSVASPERSEVREMLVGAIGCNLAWGIVDAVMYVMSSVMLRARAIRLLKKVQIASDPAEGRAAIAGMLSAFAVARLRPEILEMAREDLAAIKDAPPRAPITRDDCVGAVEVFLLVFLSTFPVVVPFIVMSDARAALRMSNCDCRDDAVHRRLVARAVRRTAPMGHGPGNGGFRRDAGRTHDCTWRVVASGEMAELKLGPTTTSSALRDCRPYERHRALAHQRDSQARASAMASAAKYSTGALAQVGRGEHQRMIPPTSALRRWRCARGCRRTWRRTSGRSSCSGRPSPRTCRARRAAAPSAWTQPRSAIKQSCAPSSSALRRMPLDIQAVDVVASRAAGSRACCGSGVSSALSRIAAA